MEKIILTKQEIENIQKLNIDNLKGGNFGVVIPYERGLGLKFSRNTLNKGFSEKALELDKLINLENQVKSLADKQSKIKLTSLPKGMAYYNNMPVAVVMDYFNNYKNLFTLPDEDYQNIIKIFEQLLYITDELIKNGIYQLDIKEDNFLYSPTDFKVEAIDLDGPLVEVKNENFYFEEMVYKQLTKMILYLACRKVTHNNESDLETINRVASIKSLDFLVYGYYDLESIIHIIKRDHLLEPGKELKKGLF